jgi:hypothetical protein
MSNPQWEYNWRTKASEWDQGPSVALSEMMEEADKLGQNGWEMVNFSLVNQYSDGIGEGPTVHHSTTRFQNQGWIVACMFKRPVV